MENNNQKNSKSDLKMKGYRPIDGEVEEMISWWKKSFVLITKTEIKTWKAMFIIAFIAGIASATVMLVSLEVETSSQASLAPAKMLFSPSSVNLEEGETFNVDLMIDTADSNVVVSNSIVLYDVEYFQLLSWNTDNSIFKPGNECADITKPCEIIEDDTANGRISITLAKPSPGINTESGKLATLSFKARKPVNSSSAISLKFSSQGSYDDSDIIIDDGNGTDTLMSVGVIATSIRAMNVAQLIVSDGAPSGELSVGTTSVEMVVKTDMNATCKYSTQSGVTFESMQNLFSTTGQTSHSKMLSGLIDGNNYNYYVRCGESQGAQNSSDYMISFSLKESVVDEVDDSGATILTLPVAEDNNPTTTPVIENTVATTPVVNNPGQASVPNPKVIHDNNTKGLSKYFKSNKKIKFSADVSSLIGGKVQILEGNKVKKESIIDSDGKWSIAMDFKKSTSVSIKYLDSSGVEISSKKYKIKIDNEKPSISGLPSVLKKRAGDKIWWNGSDNKGIAYYKYKVDGKTKETKKEYFYLPYKIAKGPHNVTVSAYDKAGNKTTKNVLIWTW